MSNPGLPDNRVAAGILSFLLNPLGIHGFLLTTKSDQYFPGSAKSAQAIRITSIIVWAAIVCAIIGSAVSVSNKEETGKKTAVFPMIAMVVMNIVILINFIQTMIFVFRK